MDREVWQQHFRASPSLVQDYLFDDISGENEDRAKAYLAYEDDAWDRVVDLAWEVIFEEVPKQEFQVKLRAVAGDRKVEDVERELLLNIVLPLADMVAWDVEGRLQELGVPLGQIQSAFRVSLRPVSYGAAARRIATLARLSVLNEEVARRLRDALVSYIKGVRTIEQVKETLQRSQNENGLGFTREQADEYVKKMQEFLFSAQVLSEQEYADWLTNMQREANIKKMEQASPAASKPATEEDSEIAQHALQTPSDKMSSVLDEAVEAAFQKIHLGGLDEYLSKRLRNIISTRLRDVRNAQQVREMLIRETKVGGLERHPEEADQIVSMIEEVYRDFRAKIEGEERQKMDQVKQDQLVKIEERKKRESAEHAQWYQQKVQSGQTLEGWQALKALRDQATAQAQQSDPSASTSDASNLRPMVDAVRAPTRLMGLADELGQMTLAEFRRLAKTPEQAVEKLEQKFATLQQESFEHWTEGVQAWRNSPLQQMYLRLVAESFASGKPVVQLVEEKRQQDPNLPTQEELGAILELNNKVRI